MHQKETEPIMNLFRQFKLGKSLFKDQFQMSKFEFDRYKLSQEELEKLVQRQGSERLALFILNNCQSEIKKEETSDAIIYKTELLVLGLKDFKSIVEAAIQIISQEDIEKIKNRKTIL